MMKNIIKNFDLWSKVVLRTLLVMLVTASVILIFTVIEELFNIDATLVLGICAWTFLISIATLPISMVFYAISD